MSGALVAIIFATLGFSDLQIRGTEEDLPQTPEETRSRRVSGLLGRLPRGITRVEPTIRYVNPKFPMHSCGLTKQGQTNQLDIKRLDRLPASFATKLARGEDGKLDCRPLNEVLRHLADLIWQEGGFRFRHRRTHTEKKRSPGFRILLFPEQDQREEVQSEGQA